MYHQMADRQYGIQPSNRPSSGSSPVSRKPLPPVSLSSSNPVQSSKRYRRPGPPSAPLSPPKPHPVPYGPPHPSQYHRNSPSPTRQVRLSMCTPGQHHYGLPAVGGGLTGFGAEIDDSPPRDSGMNVLRDIDNLYGGRMMSPSPEPEEAYERPHGAPPPTYPPVEAMMPSRPPLHRPTDSESSLSPLMPPPNLTEQRSLSPSRWERNGAAVAGPPGYQPPMPAGLEPPMLAGNHYHGDGYDGYMDPDDFADDGDHGFEKHLPASRRQLPPPPTSKAGAGAAAAGGVVGMLKSFGSSRDGSGSYASVTHGGGTRDPEKSEWLQKHTTSGRRMKWIIASIIGVLLLGGVVGGIVAGILASRHKSGSSNSSSASTTSSSSSSSSSKSLYNINSPQVQQLLNNKNLHRVFPGMDYTPLNAQHPGCLTIPPDQNNITLDVAMLSQLTPAIRLYGTDCNQTEMVLAAIDQLGYNNSIQIWLGVWLENNDTTNSRQLQQMYNILDTYPPSHFAGVIVGNEVLFRQDMTASQLGAELQSVRSNLTAKNINLPVSTSDLGDEWTSQLAQDTDIVMANVHPFFAGVTPDVASAWSWDFWQDHDVNLLGAGSARAGYPKNAISEIGWPSSGGNDCGTDTGCPNAAAGSVASIDNMNTFMDGWVCEAIGNGTMYFWFEAFDEPWKVIYNTPTDQWESHWGLMDANRNLKPGLTIPDCGGKTVDKAC